MQYRNSAQHDNVKSLEEVIKHLLDTASQKAEQAQASATVRCISLLSKPYAAAPITSSCRGAPGDDESLHFTEANA